MNDLQVSVSYGATLNTFELSTDPTVEHGNVRRSGEFERFQDLASTLLRVPKTELDEERAKE
jgi:hypothetical protein